MERGSRGVSRVLQKLDHSIEEGNYYEAHQMYRTLYFRYTGQQKFQECLNLLWNGAMKFISAKEQETSAADLGLLLVDTLEKSASDANPLVQYALCQLWMERLGQIIAGLGPNTVERETLINRSIKWSADMTGKTLGHPDMHKLVAHVFWEEGNIEQARHHYLLCRDGRLCGNILMKISVSKGFKRENDLFIAQAVLQQLCLKDSKLAETTFITYTTNHPDIRRNEAPFQQPLLNFVYLLFRCIDLGRADSFKALRNVYKSSLKRDPSFDKYLTKAGVLYFGINPPPAGGGFMGGMFGDLFNRLFQGFDDDEENDEQAQRGRANPSNASGRQGPSAGAGGGDATTISHELD